MDLEEVTVEQISFRISKVQLAEIDAAWVKKGKFNRSDGIRWLLEKGIQKAKDEGIL